MTFIINLNAAMSFEMNFKQRCQVKKITVKILMEIVHAFMIMYMACHFVINGLLKINMTVLFIPTNFINFRE